MLKNGEMGSSVHLWCLALQGCVGWNKDRWSLAPITNSNVSTTRGRPGHLTGQ